MITFDNSSVPRDASKKSSLTDVFAGSAADAVITNTDKDTFEIDSEDIFWVRNKIDPVRWNEAYPYQFLIVKKGNDGKYTSRDDLIFTLPISPESLTISTPFAISVTATQGGVIEEHNAAPFRTINISGTTGILPLRGNSGASQSFSAIQNIFASSANAGKQFLGSISKLAGVKNKPSLVSKSDIQNGDVGKSSGYFQFHAFSNFLERYVAYKKTAKGRDYALAFQMWKDQQTYLVTPQSFNLSRSSGSPFEYQYSCSMKAWKRIVINQQPPNAYNYVPAGRNQAVMGRILQGAMEARNAIAALTSTIKAVGADLDRAIMEPLRQTILFAKDILGVPKAMSDIPKQLVKSAAGAVVLFVSTRDDYQAFGGNGNGSANKDWNDLISLAAGVAKVGQAAGSSDYNSTMAVTTLDRLFSGGTFDTSGSHASAESSYVDPSMRIFNEPWQYMPLFDSIPLSALQLSDGLQRQISQDSRNVRDKFNRAYSEQLRDQTLDFLKNYENAVGAGDDVTNALYDKGTNSSTRTPTDEDFEAIYALNLYVESLNQLAVSDDINQNRIDPTAFVAGLASRSGIAFTQPRSKFSAPFPYGSSLEDLSFKYFGTPDRWLEIASLNGLRPPYVDEIGFDLALLTNANGNEIAVADSGNLFVGQAISIVSSSKSITKRNILKIKKISDTQSLITLDGDADLLGYNVSDGAILHTWLPGTVNSQMSIYIPSDKSPEFDDFIFKAIPGSDIYNHLFRVAGTDLLLSSTNDIILTRDGDSPLALGLNAIIQDLKIKTLTRKGSIIRHPNFGLPIAIGNSLADTSALSIIDAISDSFRSDPTYTKVSFAQVNISGPISAISFTVGIRGVADYIPITIALS
jgi:hypothetical protein